MGAIDSEMDRLTLILLLWGIAAAPSFAGTVTSQTPKSFFVMGLALGSQLSASLSQIVPKIVQTETY
jgi:hypothetical protein